MERHDIGRGHCRRAGLRMAWLLAAVVGVVALPAGATPAAPAAQFSADTPVRADALAQADFDAIVAEATRVAAQPRRTSVVPLPAHWRTLDRTRMLAMLAMPAFARIPESARGVLLDQAATWDLLAYRRPSDAAALWERLWPRAAHVDPGEAPNSNGIGYEPDPTWSPAAMAITTLFGCFPRMVWGAPEDPSVWAVRDPVAWQWRNEQGWDGFRDCVPTQFWDDTRPTAAGMAALLAVLQAKFGDELLSDGCSRPGPDSCLLLFQALFSLDRRDPRLSRILQVMAPAFVDTPIAMPALAELPAGGERSPADRQALGVAEAEVLRRTIFLTLKLPVLLREPAAWPADELPRSLGQATRLAVQLARIERLYQGRHQLFERYYADPWQWVDAGVDAAVADSQRELGAGYAQHEGCALAELQVKGATPSFWQGYVLDNIRRGHGDCGRFDDLRLAQVYRDAQAEGHDDPRSRAMHALAPIADLLAAGGALHERALDAMEATCSAGRRAARDPLGLCAAVAARAATRKAIADEAQAEASRAREAGQRARRLSAECADGMAARAAAALGYQDDEDVWSGGLTACRLDPRDHRRAIVALSYRAGEQLAGGVPVDDESSYDLDVVLMDVASGAIVARGHQSAAIESDAIRYEGIAIDTARYVLAPGKRAFGIRTDHGSHCYQCVYNFSRMTLFVQDGQRIDPLLELQVAETTDAATETCPEGIGYAGTTLAVGRGRSHGLADLAVETTTKVERYGDDGAATACGSDVVTTVVAHFDGHAYRLPGASAATP